MTFEPQQLIESTGHQEDEAIELAKTALALSLIYHPGLSADKYLNHFEKLKQEVHARHQELLDKGADDDAGTQLAALKHVLIDQHEYQGDRDTYDDLQNADIARVVDRRKGMPIALAIIFIDIGRRLGWYMDGLNFPGHFLCRLEKDGQRLIFDPFDGCRPLQAADLRQLLKQTSGPGAELSSHYYDSASNREILIRLQNNIKLRQIEEEDYEGAAKTVETMQMIDPEEYRLMLDAGVLYARTGKPVAAVKALEIYIDKSPNAHDRQDAALLLQQIKETLH